VRWRAGAGPLPTREAYARQQKQASDLVEENGRLREEVKELQHRLKELQKE
jgi:regulator of replication initiation timing